MVLMRKMDPYGVDLRQSQRLCRRVYYNKACDNIFIVLTCIMNLYIPPQGP